MYMSKTEIIGITLAAIVISGVFILLMWGIINEQQQKVTKLKRVKRTAQLWVDRMGIPADHVDCLMVDDGGLVRCTIGKKLDDVTAQFTVILCSWNLGENNSCRVETCVE